MYWPTPQDYNEAVQNPDHVFCDPDLKLSLPELDQLGLPRPISGGFASVYKMRCGERTFALKCFLRNIKDQQERYEHIGEFIHSDDLPYTIDFEYLKQGILVKGHWYPVLKMDWVEGHLLSEYIELNLNVKSNLSDLADRFHKMSVELHRAGIGHGDLQHGNIIVIDGELRLVDYDGMFVPSLSGRESSELGHRHYQHPGRERDHFAHQIDNFSAWSIYTSLQALGDDPSLWNQLRGGDDCLLFRDVDYNDPTVSRTFAVLENHPSREIRNLCRLLRSFLGKPLDEIPPLQPSQAEEHLASLELTALPPWTETPTWLRHQSIVAAQPASGALPFAPGLKNKEIDIRLVEELAPARLAVVGSPVSQSQPAKVQIAPNAGSFASVVTTVHGSGPKRSISFTNSNHNISTPKWYRRPEFDLAVLSLAGIGILFVASTFLLTPMPRQASTEAIVAASTPSKAITDLTARGQSLLLEDNPKAAGPVFEEALRVADAHFAGDSPQTMEALLGAAKAYSLEKDYPTSSNYLSRLLKVSKNADESRYYKEAEQLHGINQMGQGEYVWAGRHFIDIIKASSSDQIAQAQRNSTAILLLRCGLLELNDSESVGMDYVSNAIQAARTDPETAGKCITLIENQWPSIQQRYRASVLRHARLLVDGCFEEDKPKLLARLDTIGRVQN